MIYTATLPKIAASTTVDWQDSADGGVWVSQRVRGRGPCVHWLQGEGGGGYTVAEDWTTERGGGRVDHIFLALTSKVLLSTWPFLWYIYVPQFRTLSRIHLILYKICHF